MAESTRTRSDSVPGDAAPAAGRSGLEAGSEPSETTCPGAVVADDDEEAAARARASYRVGPMPAIEPDRCIAPLLFPGERVVAIRPAVRMDRMPDGPCDLESVTGGLYVTTSRILHLAPTGRVAIDLNAIEDAGVGGDELLLLLHDGRSAVFHASRPKLLRVEIAAARAAARRRRSGPGAALRGAPRPDQDRSR